MSILFARPNLKLMAVGALGVAVAVQGFAPPEPLLDEGSIPLSTAATQAMSLQALEEAVEGAAPEKYWWISEQLRQRRDWRTAQRYARKAALAEIAAKE